MSVPDQRASRPLLVGDGWFPDAPGGLNRYVRDLLRALRERGTEARAIVVGASGDPSEGVRVAAAAADPLLRRVVAVARAARRERSSADVVDVNFALYAALPCLIGSLRGVPLVLHFHGPWAEEARAAGEGAVAVAAKRLLERRLYRRADEVVVLSAAFRRLLVERYAVSPWDVRVIPPGVDASHFRPGEAARARAALGVDDRDPVVVCARRLVPRMGVDVLLEAWAALGRRGAVLLVVGDGPERTSLERLALKLGIADDVRFLGRVDDETLLAAYQAADLSVVPTLALEGFGLVVLEALATGTPVVATDAGGLPEVLAPLDPSLLVRAGSAPALAARLELALDEPSALPDAGRCRAHASGFSWAGVAERHADLYARVRRGTTGTRKPRVVYLDHCARLSGGELALVRLLRTLDEVEAHVILGEDGPLVERLLHDGVSVEVLPMQRAARDVRRAESAPRSTPLPALAGAAAYAQRVARRLRRLRPDLVHTNSLKAALYGGFAARAGSVPAVWHLRDRIAADYLPEPSVRLVRRLSRYLPEAVIANSRSTLATLPSAPHGAVVFDPVAAPIRRRDGSTNGFCVGMVGRIAPWKGQDVFLEAFARAFPDGGARAVVVGGPLFGEEDFESRLHALAAALGIGERVEFTGFREDVETELARFDALVHASVVAEPFGQVVAEGMAFGLPVIASAAGGPAEIVRHDVDGLLCPPGDVDALAAALRRLARDDELRLRLGEKAREAATRFSPDSIAADVMRVYRGVLSRCETP